MKGRTIALDHVNGREAAALISDGRLEDLFIDGTGPRVGDIHMAKVDRLIKGQGGVMVRLGEGQGYLRRAKGLALGQLLPVQISGFAEPGKAMPVSDRVLFKSRYVIVSPGAPGINVSRSIKDDGIRDALLEIAHDTLAENPMPNGCGLILRSACDGADPDEIVEDVLAMAGAAAEMDGLSADGEPRQIGNGDGAHLRAWREWSEPADVDQNDGSFERHGVLDALEELECAFVPLKSGSMWVEPTRALIAIDVNTGPDTSPAAALKCNLAALAELPRQLTIRGLGGQITVDLAPVAKKDRPQLESAARAALRRNPVETELIGWTPLGHLEFKRKRERRPLLECLA